MVVGANSKPPGIPNLGCSEEGNFICCKTAQLWYSTAVTTARLWGSPGARPLYRYTALLSSSLVSSARGRSALCYAGLVCSAQLPRDTSGVSALPGKLCSSARGELAYIDSSPHTWPQVSLSPSKWGLQILEVSLVQKALSWLVRM